MALKTGDKAADFTLFDTEKKQRSLKEFAGKNLVLAFFPGAFTGVCTAEMCALRDAMSNFNTLNAQVVGVSVDSPLSNKAFAAQNSLQFPILSDYSRSVSQAYAGLYDDFSGLPGYTASKRSVFVIDKTGTIRYAWISDAPGVEPKYDEINAALSGLK